MSLGLKVTATQKPYPFELSTSELTAHTKTLSEYNDELSVSLYRTASKYKPDLSLIKQQPEVKPELRKTLLEFLLKISIRTKVTYGIYYQAVRLFDRYCSKRVVLREQLQLVLATCLWLSAKTYGGCNHIINNTNVPPGGRFHGPTPRARIPRLGELVTFCSGGSRTGTYDEGMFVQMERHILDTLNWDISEPQLSNWLNNFYESNLIQFEMNSEHGFFDEKIEYINIKRFLSEISLLEHKLIELHPAELSTVIFKTMSEFYPNAKFQSELQIPETLPQSKLQYYQLLLCDTISNLSGFYLDYYTSLPGVKTFYQRMLKALLKLDADQAGPFKSTQFTTPLPSPMKSLATPPSSRRGSPVGTSITTGFMSGVVQPQAPALKTGGQTPPMTPTE